MQPAKYILVFCVPLLLWVNILTAQGIRIPAGAYVIANQGNIVTRNNWINDGSFTHNDGAVVFAGNTQQIGGSKGTSFNKLTISTGSNTTIVSAGHSLKQILKSNGTLNANFNFTLLANATQTALIDGSGTGEVLGNLTMQGYLANGFGYKYLSSPFQFATVNEMSPEVNLTASFPSVYKFDENQVSNGWISFTASTNILAQMSGYIFQMGNALGSKNIDMTGVVNNGNRTISLTNNNRIFTKGFNLVGNPYPSPVDWDAVTGWTRTRVDNAIYYFDTDTTDQYGGIYHSYINKISSDGKANNIIPAMQAFFVHVTDGTYPVAGTLGIGNATRVTIPVQAYRRLNGVNDPIPLLRLRVSLKGSAISDATVIYFQSTATRKFDGQLDALKLMNTVASVPSIYTLTNSFEKLSIYALPVPDSSTRIPLGLQTLQGGKVSLFASDNTAIPATLNCYLYDAVTNTYHDLKDNSHVYEYDLPAGIYEDRFFVVFNRRPILQLLPIPDITGGNFNIYGTGRNKQLVINIAQGEKAVIKITNSAGQLVFTKTYLQSGSYPLLLLLPTGIYHVSCYTGNTIITKQIFSGE
ncbi:MAG: T9SS type A sorting domain-containing protein [Sediminibacterium sp.]